MTKEELVNALKEALTDNSPDGWALLKRVPLICNDIRLIKWALGTCATLGTLIVLPILAWMLLEIINNNTQVAVLISSIHTMQK